MKIKTIGLIGAGQMGSGIAQVAILSGFDIFINDSDKKNLETGIQNIEKNLERLILKNVITDNDFKKALKRIVKITNISQFKTCDLIIEAATEQERTKQEIFQSLKPHIKKETILTSNTSSISQYRSGAQSICVNKETNGTTS